MYQVTYREESSGKLKRVTKRLTIEPCTCNNTEEQKNWLEYDAEGSLLVVHVDGGFFHPQYAPLHLVSLLFVSFSPLLALPLISLI